jgi:hypothetical protein
MISHFILIIYMNGGFDANGMSIYADAAGSTGLGTAAKDIRQTTIAKVNVGFSILVYV